LHDRVNLGDAPAVKDVIDALPARRGHFLLESGYHTDLWLTLDALFVDPAAIAPYAAALADRLRAHAPTAICGPLLGGAFLAQAIATVLGARFFVAEPAPAGLAASPAPPALFAARYRLPPGQLAHVRGERVAVVDDVISAGSSVRATIAALEDAGAVIAAAGALLVLGEVGRTHLAARGLPVEALGHRAFVLWTAADCPRCRDGLPVERP
jgi:orotate phosphoribosyltransferase